MSVPRLGACYFPFLSIWFLGLGTVRGKENAAWGDFLRHFLLLFLGFFFPENQTVLEQLGLIEPCTMLL